MKMESLLTVNYTKYAIHNSLNSQMHSEKAFIQEHLHGEKKKRQQKTPTNQPKNSEKHDFSSAGPCKAELH